SRGCYWCRPDGAPGRAEADHELAPTTEFGVGDRRLPGLETSPQRQLRTASLHGAADFFQRRLSIGGYSWAITGMIPTIGSPTREQRPQRRTATTVARRFFRHSTQQRLA